MRLLNRENMKGVHLNAYMSEILRWNSFHLTISYMLSLIFLKIFLWLDGAIRCIGLEIRMEIIIWTFFLLLRFL